MFARRRWNLVAGLVMATVVAGTLGLGTEGRAAADPVSVTVAANDPSFTDAGVAVVISKPFTITATGSAMWTPTSPSTGPIGYRFAKSDGTHTCGYDQYHPYKAPSYLAPGLNCWALVGRIGATGPIFLVGSSFKMLAPYSGELYLAFNDDYYTNNSGDYVAMVSFP